LDECSVEVDGEPMTTNGDNGWTAALSKMGLNNLHLFYTTVAPDGVIKVGEEIWLLYTPNDKITQEDLQQLVDALCRLNVTVRYRSLYGERGSASYNTKPVVQ
jgi:hypothetical protein